MGAAGTVTGSKTVVSSLGLSVLVDCGLFQGIKELRLKNWKPLAESALDVDAVVLTHAHLDHSGCLPLLVKQGFRGPIFCTFPTERLLKILLLDSAKIQEEDAARANQMGFSKHAPAQALYTVKDVERVLRLVKPLQIETWHKVSSTQKEFKFRFIPAGHILGSAIVEFNIEGKRLVFTGDLGRSKPLLMCPPETIERADILITESTYGDRNHPNQPPMEALKRIILDTYKRKGHLIIPSFAVGRAQDLLFMISQLKREGSIPDVPTFLDSPMAIEATSVFYQFSEWHRLSPKQIDQMAKGTKVVRTGRESEELVHRKDPTIVIAGSGMMTGGRVLRHLQERLGNSKNTVLLVGFQAAGTRGRQLYEGASEIKFYGNYAQVKAKVEFIQSLSAHADQRELIQWMKKIKKSPKVVFINHGEPGPADCLRVKLADELGWEAIIPTENEIFEIKV